MTLNLHSTARYAEIAVNVPNVSGVFFYLLPENLIAQILPGCLVVVPFGGQEVQGVALRLVDAAEARSGLGGREARPVRCLVDALPVLTPAQLELARWMSTQTLAPLSACVELMLPPGLNQQADTLYHLNDPLPLQAALSALAQRLVNLLRQRGDLRGRQIDAALPRQNWRAAAQALQRRGWLGARAVLPPPNIRPRMVRTVQLACPPAEVAARLETLGRHESEAHRRREAVMDFLVREPAAVDVAWVYAQSGARLPDLHRLAEAGLVILSETEAWRDPLEKLEIETSTPLELTAHQQRAWQQLSAGLQAAFTPLDSPPPPYLLHGVTGSGKTELYLRAVEATLNAGKQAVVLVPEIALTPQAVRRFASRFPGQVGLVHSRLSPGERYDTWCRARDGRLRVIIGPRSALFTALPELGLVVVDEFHETSFYQDDLFPPYHAVEAALALSRLAGGLALLGSATPDVALYHRAQQKGWVILTLPERVASVPGKKPDHSTPPPLPPVEVVDMREELKAGNRSIFSRALVSALQETTTRGQQAILFLNRRGTATYVFCRNCGYRLDCPRCDIPLTYHTSAEGLVCHRCGYQRLLPSKCPQCGKPSIRQLGAGTETVESEVKRLLPGARVLRWDAESTRQKGAHELILTHFSNHQADVLVGTQMVAKGLDLPLVTLVGAVLADTGLALPDYHAAERTFQLLTQVAGRAGRSDLGGRVILQTFQPGHYAIQYASRHDFLGFYQREMAERRRLGYPPFYHLARLEYRHREAERAEAAARDMAEQVHAWIEQGGKASGEVIGPAPCFFARVEGEYRWQIVVRSSDPAGLLRGKPLEGWRLLIDPPDLL
jgi:primosomal protein N' (replication factor Y)